MSWWACSWSICWSIRKSSCYVPSLPLWEYLFKTAITSSIFFYSRYFSVTITRYHKAKLRRLNKVLIREKAEIHAVTLICAWQTFYIEFHSANRFQSIHWRSRVNLIDCWNSSRWWRLLLKYSFIRAGIIYRYAVRVMLTTSNARFRFKIIIIIMMMKKKCNAHDDEVDATEKWCMMDNKYTINRFYLRVIQALDIADIARLHVQCAFKHT